MIKIGWFEVVRDRGSACCLEFHSYEYDVIGECAELHIREEDYPEDTFWEIEKMVIFKEALYANMGVELAALAKEINYYSNLGVKKEKLIEICSRYFDKGRNEDHQNHHRNYVRGLDAETASYNKLMREINGGTE